MVTKYLRISLYWAQEVMSSKRCFCLNSKKVMTKRSKCLTNIEVFKLFLKYCYFYDLDSIHIKDYSIAIDVFKLSHRFQIQDLMDSIESKNGFNDCYRKLFHFFRVGFDLRFCESKQREINWRKIISKLLIAIDLEICRKSITNSIDFSFKFEIMQKYLNKRLNKFRELIKIELLSSNDKDFENYWFVWRKKVQLNGN
jgi:hypothetical protein